MPNIIAVELEFYLYFRTKKVKMTSLQERYVAAMVLAGAGDAIGYKNGSWEFCHFGQEIYKELTALGGLDHIKVKREFN
jgi:hypothetical protein